MPSVLFLCTGNYYRSRYAEIRFNLLAEERDSAWRADSRGLRISGSNYGPISEFALQGLNSLGVDLPAAAMERFPVPLAEEDLRGARHIVAVKEAEHRAFLRRDFPTWEERVEFWHIHDLDFATAEEALPLLDEHVVRLFEQLHAGEPHKTPATHQ